MCIIIRFLYCSGQTKQTTTDSNGAISDADRQWLADNGGAMPISQVPAQDKALVGTGTGAAAQMSGDTNQVGTKPLDNRPPGSYNPNTDSAGGTGSNNQGGNNNSAGRTGNNNQGGNANEDVLQHSSGVRNQPGGSTQGMSEINFPRLQMIIFYFQVVMVHINEHLLTMPVVLVQMQTALLHYTLKSTFLEIHCMKSKQVFFFIIVVKRNKQLLMIMVLFQMLIVNG